MEYLEFIISTRSETELFIYKKKHKVRIWKKK